MKNSINILYFIAEIIWGVGGILSFIVANNLEETGESILFIIVGILALIIMLLIRLNKTLWEIRDKITMPEEVLG